VKGEEVIAVLALITFGYFVLRKPKPDPSATWPGTEPVHVIPPEPTFTV
jgi:hypothetical protein